MCIQGSAEHSQLPILKSKVPETDEALNSVLLDWKANSGHAFKKCNRKGLRDTSPSFVCVCMHAREQEVTGLTDSKAKSC